MGKMMNLNDILQGISTVVNKYGHDGALDSEGDPVEIGLKREEGHPINDSRVIDGFNIQFRADKMILNYHSEIMMSDVHKNGFESGVEQTMADVVRWIKKEYKKLTGDAVTLSAQGEVEMHVETSSRVRAWVRARREYVIGGLDSIDSSNPEKTLDAKFKSWLEKEPKDRPDNEEISKKKNEREDIKRIIKK